MLISSDRTAVFVKDYVSSLSMPDRHTAPRSGTTETNSPSTERKELQMEIKKVGSAYESVYEFRMKKLPLPIGTSVR
jgi:hypothetical protein